MMPVVLDTSVIVAALRSSRGASSALLSQLAVPSMALSLLAQMGGEGFSTQQFTTDLGMLLGLILRPVLMTIGLVMGLVAFNTIMQITNTVFGPAVANMTPSSDNSLLSLGIYVMLYATLCYTLANSAFKMIDLMPNWVMNWMGARLETMTDDAAQIQQQSGAYLQSMAYSMRQSPQGPLSPQEALHQKVQAAQDAAYAESHGIGSDTGGAAAPFPAGGGGNVTTGGTGTAGAGETTPAAGGNPTGAGAMPAGQSKQNPTPKPSNNDIK